MLRCIFCVLASYVVFSMLSVFAQSSPSSSSSTPSVTDPNVQVKKRIVYREKSYYDYEDTLIEGDRTGPDGSSVFRKDRIRFKSALDLKRSFIPELKDSASSAR